MTRRQQRATKESVKYRKKNTQQQYGSRSSSVSSQDAPLMAAEAVTSQQFIQSYACRNVLGKVRAVRVSSVHGDMAASSSGDGSSAQMSGDQQLVVLISERQGRIVGLPTHQCYTEMKAYALPSLKQLHSSPLFSSKTEMRFFLISAMLYAGRAVSIVVMQVSVADPAYYCVPKLNSTISSTNDDAAPPVLPTTDKASAADWAIVPDDRW
ncbi:unnamed protein product [Sphagnum balticum]